MAKDILLDENGDLKIENGDLVIGDSSQQEIEQLVTGFKGEFKEFPIMGVGISKFLKTRGALTAAVKEIKIQLKSDGFNVNTVKIQDQNIFIDAKRS